jgi:hypothetical protein
MTVTQGLPRDSSREPKETDYDIVVTGADGLRPEDKWVNGPASATEVVQHDHEGFVFG